MRISSSITKKKKEKRKKLPKVDDIKSGKEKFECALFIINTFVTH